MALIINSIVPFWASQPSLTALVPAAQVWLDFCGDTSLMPYVVFSQVNAKYQYSTGANYLGNTLLQITVYASTMAQMIQIANAVKTAFKFAALSAVGCELGGFITFLENEIPRMEQGNAYSCTLTFRSMENEA